MKIKALVLASALLVCGAAFAQETNRDANGKIQYGPYETNKFGDNWFIGVGAGLNATIDGVIHNKIGYGAGLNVDVNFGKWFDPCWGARIGWSGWSTGVPGTGFKPFGGRNYNYVHIDGLMNFSHLVAGYKEKRIVNVVPFVSAGSLFGKTDKGIESNFGWGAGIMVPFRCGKVVSIVPELRVIAGKDVFGGQAYMAEASAILGIYFNLGNSSWTRKSTSLAAAASALAASEAARLALQADNDKLAAERANDAALAARLAQENKDLQDQLAAAAAQKGVKIDLGENPVAAYFEIGKTTLSEKEIAHLDYAVKTALAANKDVKLVVTGSADQFGGSAKRNQKLAEKRAQYVFDLLTSKYGLSADNFQVESVVVDGKSALSRAVFIGK